MSPKYYEFAVASTWVLDLACVDEAGEPLDIAGGAVQIRVASPSALLIDLHLSAVGAGFNTGIARLVVAPEDQLTIIPGYYRYETRAILGNGLIYDQLRGNLKVLPSLYQQFPYTPPVIAGPPGELTFNRVAHSGLITLL